MKNEVEELKEIADPITTHTNHEAGLESFLKIF